MQIDAKLSTYKEGAAHVLNQEIIGPQNFATELASLQPYLVRRAMYLTRERELAEDLAQSTILKALRRKELFTPGTNLKAWVTTILQNEFYSNHRKSWRSTPLSDSIMDTMAVAGSGQEASVGLCQVACALDLLPVSQREALLAVSLVGLSYVEAAFLFDCTIGTIKSRVSRARSGLLTALERGTRSRRRSARQTPERFATWMVEIESIRVAAVARLAKKNLVPPPQDPSGLASSELRLLAAA